MGTGRNEELDDRVAAIVLAGGQGTRLFPLTQTRCKPAVGFGGRYRLIDIPLSNSLNSRIHRLFVISQYFASHLNHHITSTYHSQQENIDLLCPEENATKKEWFEGTADAVRKNLDHLLKTPAEYFLILSGDQLYNLDFRNMIDFAKKKKADLVIATLPVGEEEAKRMGVMQIDKNQKVLDFYEKPKERAVLDRFALEGKYLGSMGIYVFARKTLIALLQEKGNDFGQHLLPIQVKRDNTYAYIYDGYWVDIGTIGSFYTANMALLNRKDCIDMYDEAHPIFTRPHNLPSPLIRDTIVRDSLISQGSIIDAKEITHSVIGVRSRIKKGTVIRDSIVMGNHFYEPPAHQVLPSDLSIGENCLIEKAIVDEHCHIGNNVQLINRDKRKTLDGDGVYIRDGIIIVTSGTTLPDGYVI